MGAIRNRKNYTQQEREEILRLFKESGLGRKAFCAQHTVAAATLFQWLQREGLRPASKKRTPGKGVYKTGRTTPFNGQERKEAVEAFLKSGLSPQDFGRTWGISDVRTIQRWVQRYQNEGPQSLDRMAPRKQGSKKPGPKPLSRLVTDEIKSTKLSHPEFGLKKVRDFLSRFRGVKVSTGSIRKTIREEKLPLAQRPKKRRRSADKIRHFERAKPMQLWQSDITSFVLTRHSTRIYLTVFMDDHSRYIVAWNLQLRQTGEFVMTTLLNGISRFGKPEEVLTDQGRQYFAWRGKSDFQKLLDKEGIRHVVARSHHPQTLGKCERFWETVGQEFWSRVKPQDLNDARERFAHFVAHYNHSRPHQGLDGMVPADRFFCLESDVRKVIESTHSQNELRISLGEAPRSPVFLLGQIGDQTISLHGEGGTLILRHGDGPEKRIESPQYGHFKPDLYESKNGGEEDETERDNGSSDNLDETQKEKSAISCSEVSGDSCEGTLGRGLPRGSAESSKGSGCIDGVLVGVFEQDRDCQGDGGPASSHLADVTASNFGYARRTTDPAPNEGKEGEGTHGDSQQQFGSEESERRPKETSEENSRTRENSRNSNEINRDTQRVSESTGVGHSSTSAQSASAAPERCRVDSNSSPDSSNEGPRNREQEAWKTTEESRVPSDPDEGSTPGSSS
jgi:transposase InsO family protein